MTLRICDVQCMSVEYTRIMEVVNEDTGGLRLGLREY